MTGHNRSPIVSGRYRYPPDAAADASLMVVVRVDVDGPRALNTVSVEVSRRFPPVVAHGVAPVTADRVDPGRRVLEADLSYLEGDANLLPGRHLIIEASGLQSPDEAVFTLAFADRPGLGSYPLAFESPCFDPVEFEVDRVENAGPTVTAYHTGAHPNRPSSLPQQELTLASVFREAGFDAVTTPQTDTIPLAGAGADGAWTDDELHNAMVTYWSRFAHRPQWALWVLYASQHQQGEQLGGVMFDDIGPHHRQGTAIFTGSFIRQPPPGDPAPEAWRNRMQFLTAIHEIGHAFNLAHSWQKGLVTPLGDPWVPLANQPEARSFMNYPFNVQGGEAAFFEDFHFGFTEEELLFMRHAPRRFVQMGGADWFEGHGHRALHRQEDAGPWRLQIRSCREANIYAFLEPVVAELKLTNRSDEPLSVDDGLLSYGNSLNILVQRDGGAPRHWRRMLTHCYQPARVPLAPGESLYGDHNISASTDGWLIDEPGFYKVQAALELDGHVVLSDVLRLYVAPPREPDEDRLAPDYFTEDVARALVFHGVPALPGAMSILQGVAARCPRNPAALHAAMAVSAPDLQDYKLLDSSDDERLRVRCHRARVAEAAPLQTEALIAAAPRAADTFGHLAYCRALDSLTDALWKHGDQDGARRVLRSGLDTMKQRALPGPVIRRTEERLTRLK